MKAKKIIKKLLFISLPLIGGFLVGLLINSNAYASFNKPPLSPPGILFPIVWSILYTLMGISYYIIVKNSGPNKNRSAFIKQLIVNYIWPILFFNFKLYFVSVLWLLLLIFLVINMISCFYETKKIAAYLQFPYFIWLLFALYLNIGVAILN